MERHDGENWIKVGEAAKTLDVPVDHLHRRAPRHFETKRLGDHTYMREADVRRFKVDGLPEPHLEGLQDGSLVDVPDEWCVSVPPGQQGRPHGYIVLKPITAGNGQNSREFYAGDIFPAWAGKDAPLDRMVAGGDLAALPIDGGLLGLVRVVLEREKVLEAYLALDAARAEARTNSRYTADKLIAIGLITEDQFEAAREFHNAPDDADGPAVNTDEGVAYFEAREREFAKSSAPSFSVRPGPVKE